MEGDVNNLLTRDFISVLQPRFNVEISSVNKYRNHIKPIESSIGFYAQEDYSHPGKESTRAVRELSEVMEWNIHEDIKYVWCYMSRQAKTHNRNVFYEVRFICYSERSIQILESIGSALPIERKT